MDLSILYKMMFFCFIFHITPGPVWVSVMEATRTLSIAAIGAFFARVFLPVNGVIQFSQALLCYVFADFIVKAFAELAVLLYIGAASYILYLAWKTIQSKQNNQVLKLSFTNLAMVMLLSPKIWLLFPSGGVIAVNLTGIAWLNALVYASCLFFTGTLMFFLYVGLGKMATKILGDKFAYLSATILVIFAAFLLSEI